MKKHERKERKERISSKKIELEIKEKKSTDWVKSVGKDVAVSVASTMLLTGITKGFEALDKRIESKRSSVDVIDINEKIEYIASRIEKYTCKKCDKVELAYIMSMITMNIDDLSIIDTVITNRKTED